MAQHAAVACFESQTLALCEQRRGELQRRRDRVLEGLERVGLPVPVPPDGAFYAWADCSAHADSSWALCHDLLERAHLVQQQLAAMPHCGAPNRRKTPLQTCGAAICKL